MTEFGFTLHATDGAARLDWALSEPVDAVIVELGANDALRGLPVAQAEQALDQLLAALAGLIWLDESWSLRLVLSTLGILGGIALVIAGRPPSGEKSS